jgi:hypothetical protein
MKTNIQSVNAASVASDLLYKMQTLTTVIRVLVVFLAVPSCVQFMRQAQDTQDPVAWLCRQTVQLRD